MTDEVGKRRVGDVAPSGRGLEGEQLNVRGLVGAEFTIVNLQERDGDNGPYLIVEIELEGKPAFFFSSHQVIYSKLLKCVDSLPLEATITQEVGKTNGREYFDIH